MFQYYLGSQKTKNKYLGFSLCLDNQTQFPQDLQECILQSRCSSRTQLVKILFWSLQLIPDSPNALEIAVYFDIDRYLNF